MVVVAVIVVIVVLLCSLVAHVLIICYYFLSPVTAHPCFLCPCFGHTHQQCAPLPLFAEGYNRHVTYFCASCLPASYISLSSTCSRILNTTVMSAAYGVSLSLLRPLLLELLLPSKSTTFVSIGWHKLRTAQTVHTLIERKQLRSRHFYRSHFTSSAWDREENHVPTTMQQRNNFWLLFPFSENCKESCVLLNIWKRISFR